MPEDVNRPHVETATDIPAADAAGDADRHRIPGALPNSATASTPTSATFRSAFDRVPEIPGFQIQDVLGRGGMGIVFRAIQKGLNRTVAVKAILNAEMVGPTGLARFLAEAEVVAAVRHPAVVEVYDLGNIDGQPFLVMEYLPGGSLTDRLRAGPRPSPGETADLLERIARGVAAAHAQNIVHRDLKPSNILFDECGLPKVTDFGIAKRSASELTATRAQLGTPSYMAPEQATDGAKSVGPTADVWALGVMMYECLTGQRPFVSDSVAGVIVAACTTDPVPLSQANSTVPRDLIYVCMKCLRKSPDDRYPTAADLADDLARFVRGEPIHALRDEYGYRARRFVRRWWKRSIGLIVIAGVGIGLWHAPPPGRPAGDTPAVSESPQNVDRLRREQVEFQVKAILRKPPAPLTAPALSIEDRNALPPLPQASFKVLWEDQVVDLRAWHTVVPGGPPSYMITDVRRSVYKDEMLDQYPVRMSPRGDAEYFRVVSPNPDTARVLKVPGPATELKQLNIDISHIPDDGTFGCYYITTDRNAIRSAEEQWVGIAGESLTSTLLIIFPADQPFKSYSVVQIDASAGTSTPYTGPLTSFAGADNTWLYCEIANDQPDVDYRVRWEW